MRVQLLRSGRLKRFTKPAAPQIKRWHIYKGDTVEVLSGTDSGKQGKVLWIDREKNRVFVEGVKLVRSRIASQSADRVGYSLRPAGIHVSNVQLVDPTVGQGTRVAIRFAEDGARLRISKRTGAVIPRPERSAKAPPPAGPQDTPVELAAEVTYSPASLDEAVARARAVLAENSV